MVARGFPQGEVRMKHLWRAFFVVWVMVVISTSLTAVVAVARLLSGC